MSDSFWKPRVTGFPIRETVFPTFVESQGCPQKDCDIQKGHMHMDTSPYDNVNRPQHYNSYQDVEVIEITEWLNFNLGNAVKYIARAGLKNRDTELEDLKKAMWYLNREIIKREENSVVDRVIPNRSQPPIEKVRRLIEQMVYNRGRVIGIICAFNDQGLDQDLDELRHAADILRREMTIVSARSQVQTR